MVCMREDRDGESMKEEHKKKEGNVKREICMVCSLR